MLERVVVTGMGIISCLGNDASAVRHALFEGKSGIAMCQAHVDAGMRSHIAGIPQIDLSEHIDRKNGDLWEMRLATPTSAYSKPLRSPD